MSWFTEWARHHATVFGILDEAGLAMLASWEPLFLAAGYLGPELHLATDWLAVNAPPRFRTDHLPALRQRLLDRRAVAYAAAQDAREDDRGTCVRCGGNGREVVPHPAGAVGGEWRPLRAFEGGRPLYYTLAVFCPCPLGRWALERTRKHAADKLEARRLRTLTLEEYQAANPRWQQQLWQRDREQRAEAALGPPPLPRWAAVVGRIRERFGLLTEED